MEQTLLPAASCLPDHIDVVGVYSRTVASAERLARAWGVTPLTDLAILSRESIDLIVVAVTTRNVPTVISQLGAYDLRHTTVMLDTPVVSSLRQLACFVHLRSCKEILVSEDLIAQPQIQACGELIEQGRLGTLRKIWLNHSGFRYHAVATLRRLAGKRYVLCANAARYGRDCSEITLRFSNSVTATVIEPRDYASGRLLVAGTTGIAADYPLFHPNATRIRYLFKGGRYSGLAIDDVEQPRSTLDELYFQNLPYEKLVARNLNAMLKIRGAVELLAAVANDDPRYKYGVNTALYDTITVVLCERLRFWVDPLVLVGQSAVDLILLKCLPIVLQLAQRAGLLR
jgi:hypothetical protein